MESPSTAPIKTKSLELVAHTPEQLRTLMASLELYEQRFGLRLADGFQDFMASDEVSPDWLAQLQAATAADPWKYGFVIVHSAENVIIGMAGYKGPPDEQGLVEISYGIAPGYQHRGFATEAAQGLIAYALDQGRARTFRAHTSSEANASTRVLEKCGFRCLGEVIDPEDGVVWRWEKEYAEPGV
ncbi:MAG TPA: GNAT family N-acetyltransferase [Verrucomicrobiales bacterium]|nr:GNAT family N-acetyltransferase [Verrucomicrobiales bacterium]